MKRKQKILSLILAGLLTLSLAACGAAPKAETTAPETEAPSAETPAAEAPATETPATETPAAEEPVTTEATASTADGITFSTTDLDGNAWTEADIAGKTLTMINFWEYWCGPCAKELPDLAKLYEDYQDQGLLILGVFSDKSDVNSVRSTVEKAGVGYPVLYYADGFSAYQTGFVPTTIFVDENGQVVGDPIVGAKSYEAWAEIIEGLL